MVVLSKGLTGDAKRTFSPKRSKDVNLEHLTKAMFKIYYRIDAQNPQYVGTSSCRVNQWTHLIGLLKPTVPYP